MFWILSLNSFLIRWRKRSPCIWYCLVSQPRRVSIYAINPLWKDLLGCLHSFTKGNQPWIFTGRMDAEAELPILQSPDMKSQLTGKDPDAGKDWGREEKRAKEVEIVRWHQRWCYHVTWTGANSERWWGARNTGMLQSTGLRRVRYNLKTEQQHSLAT